LLVLLVGRGKSANDDGEIRGLRAEISAAAQRLELAREKYDAVASQLAQLKDKVAQQDEVIGKLRTVTLPFGVSELTTSNTEVKNALTELTAYTGTLGQALRMGLPRSTGGSG
jgi:chromosome segregation ATPase